MKPRRSNQRNAAMTLVEVLVVIAVLAIFAVLLLPALAPYHDGSQRIDCINNLKEIGLAYRIWAGDNNDKYPMEISMTNGGTMELAATGNVVATFQIMSNELSTPIILICPQDKEHIVATNFGTALTSKNISYFVGLDTDETNQQVLLSGDDNFAVDGIPIESGLVQFSANSNVAWASGRHVSYNSHFWTPARNKFFGNIAFADGSVQQVTTEGLQNALRQTGVAANRLAIP